MNVRETLAGLFAAWALGDAHRSSAYFATDAAYTEAGRAPIVGREAIVEHFTKFFRDGPRFELSLDDTLVEGERAVVRYRFAIYDESGKRTERTGCAFVAFLNGTIVEWREYEG